MAAVLAAGLAVGEAVGLTLLETPAEAMGVAVLIIGGLVGVWTVGTGVVPRVREAVAASAGVAVGVELVAAVGVPA